MSSVTGLALSLLTQYRPATTVARRVRKDERGYDDGPMPTRGPMLSRADNLARECFWYAQSNGALRWGDWWWVGDDLCGRMATGMHGGTRRQEKHPGGCHHAATRPVSDVWPLRHHGHRLRTSHPVELCWGSMGFSLLAVPACVKRNQLCREDCSRR